MNGTTEYLPAFGNGSRSPLDPTSKRIEIDEFIADPVMTNLFLLALRSMQLQTIQKIEDEDWFSFYNLSGGCACDRRVTANRPLC